MTSFDDAAADYDGVANSTLGVWLRARVRAQIAPTVTEGSRVLDLGGGTGLDAEWLLASGASVTMIEKSLAMADLARERLGDRPRILVGDAAEVDAGAETYDVVISNFGVLNCLQDLDPIGERLRRWTVAGSDLFLVVMGRVAPWEIAGGLRHLDRSRVVRRVTGGDAEVRYWSPRRVEAALGSSFARQSLIGLGVALPTYQQRGAVEGRPRLMSTLSRLDRTIEAASGRLGMGDHWVGHWRRT